MGWYIYPQAPGTQNGPCDHECIHIDCAVMRADAARLCRICHQPIGYGGRVYFEADSRTNKPTPAVHAACLEAAETERIATQAPPRPAQFTVRSERAGATGNYRVTVTVTEPRRKVFIRYIERIGRYYYVVKSLGGSLLARGVTRHALKSEAIKEISRRATRGLV